MSCSNGPDLYRRSLAFAKATWNEHKGQPRAFYPPRHKKRVFSRSEKRRARREVRVEVANDNADTLATLSADPCENGTCAFCHDGGNETAFERTRMAAAQRGAI